MHYSSKIDSENGYKKYLETKKWDYNFENEYTTSDWEQSLLSRMIFMNLFEFANESYKCSIRDNISITIESNEKKVDFLFDVMHNPNENKQPYNQAHLNGINNLLFEGIYHTIGNFAPVPRTIVSKFYGPNLQMIHLYLNELWPWFLKYLKDNWIEWPTKVHEFMSFKEYIKCSCQHLYYKKIFDDFYGKYNSNYLNKVKWKEVIKKWNKQIDEDNFDDSLISFNDLFAENNIEEIDKQINFLIEARGRCIVNLL